MRRVLTVACFILLFAAVGMSSAQAGGDVATTITVDQASAIVNGKPLDIGIRLRDPQGHPVTGALVRLLVPVVFEGSKKSEIVGEATTDDSGSASIRFAPAQTGIFEGTISFWGSTGHSPADATVTLDVRSPAFTYNPGPVGLQAWWARSYIILVPFAVIWSIYLVLLWIVAQVRGVGAAASVSSDIAARKMKEETMHGVKQLFKWVAAMAVLTMLLAACAKANGAAAGPATSAPATAAPTTAAPTTVAPATGAVAVSVGETDVMHMFMKLDTPTVAAGSVTFTVTNDGVKKHEFVVLLTKTLGKDLPYSKADDEVAEEGKGIDSPGEIGELKPGETKTLTLDLEAGHYVLVCNIKGHWRMGMYTDFQVT